MAFIHNFLWNEYPNKRQVCQQLTGDVSLNCLASPHYTEDEGSFQLSLFEEELRQRSSIVFDIDEDDYLVSTAIFEGKIRQNMFSPFFLGLLNS